MADSVEMLKVPKPIFDNLEAQAVELAEIRKSLTRSKKVLLPYFIKAVVTNPPSGRDAAAVLAAVEDLVSIALLYGERAP